MSIGLIDSGIGGLTTLCECIKAYPENDYIYIADTLYAPYGLRSREFLVERSSELVKMLVKLGAKAVIFACNSCSASTLNRKISNVPIIRVLPDVKRVFKETSGGVLLLATPVTIASDMIKQIECERLIKLADKNLATLVENNVGSFYNTKSYLEQLLLPYKDCEALILGCTHYLFLKDIIAEILPEIKIYDSNEKVIKSLSGLKHSQSGTRQIFVTGKHSTDYSTLLNTLIKK